MGLSIEAFYDLTPREFDNIAKGYARKLERNERLTWEQTRAIMFTTAQPNIPKAKRGMKITDFFPLPWDQEQAERKKKLSKKEAQEMFKKWDSLEFKKQE